MFKLPTTENQEKGLRDISVDQREYPHLIPRFVFGSFFVYELRRQVREISGNPTPSGNPRPYLTVPVYTSAAIHFFVYRVGGTVRLE